MATATPITRCSRRGGFGLAVFLGLVLAVCSASAEPLVVVVHDYADRSLRFHVFLAHDPGGEVRMDRPRASRWVGPGELGELEMPEANRVMLRALRSRLGG